VFLLLSGCVVLVIDFKYTVPAADIVTLGCEGRFFARYSLNLCLPQAFPMSGENRN